MADIYVLTGNNAGELRVVFHFPVPNTNNAVGINFRTALIASGEGLREDGRRTILPAGDDTGGTISTAEEDLLDSGELIEVVRTMRIADGASNSTLISQAQANYASVNTSVQQTIGSRLNFFGHTLDAT